MTEKDRFDAKLIVTPGCWLWTGYIDTTGYGKIFVDGKSIGAHRLSYALHKGSIPAGLIVCHSCDTRNCVNPDHLWLGTDKLNAEDKMVKGRWSNGAPRTGEKHPLAKLTEADVYAIRADPRGISDIAASYQTTGSNIRGIKSRAIWKHLPVRDCDVKSIDGRRRRQLGPVPPTKR